MRPLLIGLLRATGLELVFAQDGPTDPVSGIIEVCDARRGQTAFESPLVPSFRLHLTEARADSSVVAFSDSERVPAPFRGRTLLTESVSAYVEMGTGETLAAAGRTPVWTSRSDQGHRHDAAAVSRSSWCQSACLFQHLNGDRFMGLLPLVEWARSVSGWHDWHRPPVRACFMIDDPNLHSTTYGFVSFEELIAAGRRHGFHTSLATIPLDHYYVNPAAAGLLRESPDTISLLVHGNNHTYRELATSEPPHVQVARMRQALARIERLEGKTGLSVARWMAPPHGACSTSMMRAMAEAGFQGACVSHGSVHAANAAFEWTSGLGADPTMVINGLPVIPRFGVAQTSENQLLVSVYLGQPIVAMAHHWDLAEGASPLVEAAKSINALGEVAWSNLSTIARTNYCWKIDGATILVRSFSRDFLLNVPEGVNSAEIEFATLGGAEVTLALRTRQGGTPLKAERRDAGVWRCSLPGSCLLEVNAGVNETDAGGVVEPRTPLLAVARRGITEARDRLMPLVPRRRADG